MAKVRRFLSTLAALVCFCAAAAAQDVPDAYAKIILTPSDAIGMYEGKWAGTQNVFLPSGRQILNFHVEQNFYWATVENERVLVGSGYLSSAGDRIDTFSSMRDRFTHLEMIVKDSKNTEYAYLGYVIKGAVVWVPRARCLLLDVQNDTFHTRGEFIDLFSENLKFVRQGGYSGALIVKSLLAKKAASAEDASKKAPGRFIFKRGGK